MFLPANPGWASEPAIADGAIQVLASYHRGNPWSDDLVGRVVEAATRLEHSGGLSVDYLDARRLPERDAFSLERRRLAGRRAVTPAQRLLLLDDAALRFYLAHTPDLGDPQRVVALGINDPALRGKALARGVRLIVNRPAERESLHFLLEAFGTPLPLLVLGDRSDVGVDLTRQFLDSLDKVDGAYAAEVLWEWKPVRVKQALASLPPSTRVYLVEGQTTGAADLDAQSRQWLPALAADGVPVFCHLPYQLALGCAGGAMLDTRRLAQLAVETLVSPAFARLPPVQEVGVGRRVLSAGLYREVAKEQRGAVEWLGVEDAISTAEDRANRIGWVSAVLAGGLMAIIVALGWSRRRAERQRQRLMLDRHSGLPTRQALEAGFSSGEAGHDGWLFELLSPDLRDCRQRLGASAARTLFLEQLRLMRGFLPAGWRLHVGTDLGVIGVIPATHGEHAERDFDAFLARLSSSLGDHAGRPLGWYASLLSLEGGDVDFAQCCAALDDGLLRLERQGWRQPVIRVAPLARDRASRFQRLSRDLEALIDDPGREWRLMIQPKVSPDDGALLGGEVLIRWHHPEFGLVSPGEFLPIVEILGLSARLDYWVMTESLAWLARHPDALPRLAFNVNLSSLAGGGFHQALADQLERLALSPDRVEIEITEHADFSDLANVERIMGHLRRLGVRLALDDFGTGRTAFQLLQRLPLTTAKLDRSLLQATARYGRAREAYTALVRFCEALGLAVVAEGVETLEEARWLVTLGVGEVQGFYFARPMALDDYLAWRHTRVTG